MHDVFMIDTDFKIERPKRYYRQGLNLLTHPEIALEDEKADKRERRQDRGQIGGSMKARLSKIFHIGNSQEAAANGSAEPPDSAQSHRRRDEDYDSPSSPDNSEDEGEGEHLARQITPILDPSTNTNPLLGPDENHEKNGSASKDKKRKKPKQSDVSKHTFYIENSQMRLKLFARNEVRRRCFFDRSGGLTSGIAADASVDCCP